MKNKGFTLIELLATIVILAIIALIAVPIILNVIEKARVGSAESSALGYIDAVEKQIGINLVDKDKLDIKEGTYTISELTNLGVRVKGSIPSKGVIEITKKVETGILCINNYQIKYENGKSKVEKKDCSEIEEIIINKNFNSEKGVNKPQLSEGMKPVKWDNNNTEIETNENDPEWYDYNSSKWANVKTKDGSYFVWIPRYAYKITSGYHSSTAGTIDIKFLKGTSDETVDGIKIETTGYVAGSKDTSMHYFTHPAFQNEINKYGYWVAKYEPTAVEGVVNGYYSDWSCPITGDNVATKTIKVVPNATSWRCINISNAYKASVLMKDKKEVYGWNSSEVDTHMATNLEWGAIYYLSYSSYGTNKEEVYINNNQNYITGCAGDTASASTSTATICKNPYDSENGVKASTTWNITGVYDMSGGSWERTMSVYNNLLTSSGFTTEEYNGITTSHITKYTTQTNNLLNNVGMDYDIKVYGDGIYETSNNANRYNGTEWVGNNRGGWNREYSYLPYASTPWFNRGANFHHTSLAGLGGFSYTNGGAHGYTSFRPIVSVK